MKCMAERWFSKDKYSYDELKVRVQLLDLNSLGGSAIIVHFCDHILAQLCFVFGLPSFLHWSKMMKKKANEVKANEAVSVEKLKLFVQ